MLTWPARAMKAWVQSRPGQRTSQVSGQGWWGGPGPGRRPEGSRKTQKRAIRQEMTGAQAGVGLDGQVLRKMVNFSTERKRGFGDEGFRLSNEESSGRGRLEVVGWGWGRVGV